MRQYFALFAVNGDRFDACEFTENFPYKVQKIADRFLQDVKQVVHPAE